MANQSFGDKVNAVSNLIYATTDDPSERFGIASALKEIYRYELEKCFTLVTPEKRAEDKKGLGQVVDTTA